MPSLQEIRFYPVKSCAAINLTHAEITPAGLRSQGVYDRQWMIVDEQGLMLSQRNFPQMARIKPRLAESELRLSYAGLDLPELVLPQQLEGVAMQVEIWEKFFIGLRQAQHYSDWFSAILGVRCHLVRLAPDSLRLTNPKWTEGQQTAHHFADGYPYLICNQASLAELNQRLQQAGRDALPMDRFRANLVIDGLEAYEEDYVGQLDFANGVSLKLVKPCPRCPIPSIDQLTGEIGPDPLDIMQAYRSKAIVEDGICFGMNGIVETGAGLELALGMRLEATLAF